MKRVAILLATYNGARWLTEQLDSLLAGELSSDTRETVQRIRGDKS